ncbi:very short patch repair endonuclease [Burkholderia cepacia]|uniref:very short patch repair endonuclease n=1 Tax=Burkholderia cepacia TaxID=292 RepID=UPI002FE27CBD
MVDKISAEARSKLMGRIHGKDTKPELAVRSILHRLGFRFRLHRKDLPGRPDIVLPRHRKIILVQGCFWHGHTCRRGAKPKSNQDFWAQKILSNQERDRQNLTALTEAGWSVLELWECEIRAGTGLTERIIEFMRT